MHSSREALFLLISIPLYAILIGAEIILSNWQHRKFYSWKATLQNVYLTLVNAGLDFILRTAFYVSVLMWSYEQRFFTIENVYLYWFLLFILEDFAFYIEIGNRDFFLYADSLSAHKEWCAGFCACLKPIPNGLASITCEKSKLPESHIPEAENLEKRNENEEKMK